MESGERIGLLLIHGGAFIGCLLAPLCSDFRCREIFEQIPSRMNLHPEIIGPHVKVMRDILNQLFIEIFFDDFPAWSTASAP
jgi:hypothetical protein